MRVANVALNAVSIYSRNIGFDESHAVPHGDRSDLAVEVRCRDTFCFVAGCIHAVAGRGGKLVRVATARTALENASSTRLS